MSQIILFSLHLSQKEIFPILKLLGSTKPRDTGKTPLGSWAIIKVMAKNQSSIGWKTNPVKITINLIAIKQFLKIYSCPRIYIVILQCPDASRYYISNVIKKSRQERLIYDYRKKGENLLTAY